MITIVIPTYREAGQISETLSFIQANDRDGLVRQVIVADAASPDETAKLAVACGAETVTCPRRGRGAQLNSGAAQATQPILYFLHADSRPPVDFARQIRRAVEGGAPCGCFRLRFSDPHPFLAFFAWFTRWNLNAFRFGDQSLFVTRELFHKVGGFHPEQLVLEDQEIVVRLRRLGRFRVLRWSVSTSARKYRQNGVYRTQAVFFLVYAMYRLGFSQKFLLKTYRRLIRSEQL